jgi:hypothetical protein
MLGDFRIGEFPANRTQRREGALFVIADRRKTIEQSLAGNKPAPIGQSLSQERCLLGFRLGRPGRQLD